MPAKDIFHQAVRHALEKDGWTITHDPYSLTYGSKRLFVDLGAENILSAEKGMSKIASTLHLGAGVVTTRSNMHWLVTEYGAVNLYGKSLQQRAKMIISVSHPDHQEALDKAAFERYGPHFHFIGR